MDLDSGIFHGAVELYRLSIEQAEPADPNALVQRGSCPIMFFLPKTEAFKNYGCKR